MGGGQTQAQKNATQAEAEATKQNSATQAKMLDIWDRMYGKISPYGESLLKNGLPFYNAMTNYANGISARNNAGARASIMRQIGGANNPALPSGFAQQLLADNSAQNARSFDTNMINALLTNYNAKNQAAGLLSGQQTSANPLGWAGAVTQGNNAIMQAPVQPGMFGNIMNAVTGLGSQAMKVWG